MTNENDSCAADLPCCDEERLLEVLSAYQQAADLLFISAVTVRDVSRNACATLHDNHRQIAAVEIALHGLQQALLAVHELVGLDEPPQQMQ